MRKLISLIVVILVVNLAGCEKTTMQKLASNTAYSDMNSPYWSSQQERHTQLWEDASTYCKKNTEKPNCSAVILVSTMSNGNTKLVPLGK